MMNTATLVTAGVLLAGSCLQGLTGFGYSLFSLPLLLFLMPARTAVPILSVTSIMLNLLVLLRARSDFDARRMLPLMVSGVAGIPAGVLLLRSAEDSLMNILIALLVIMSSVAFLAGFRVRVKREKAAMVPVGLLSGVLNGATTFSGPPVILLLANQGFAKHPFRAGLAAYFLLLNIAALPVFMAGGLLTARSILETAYMLPGVILGSLAGIRLAEMVSERFFRKLALAALCLLGLFSLLSGLRSLV